MSVRGKRVLTAAAILSLAAILGPATGAEPRGPDAALVAARIHKSDPSINFLTYQHSDQLFNTRPVAPGKATWTLSMSKKQIGPDFTFDVDGKKTTLVDFLSGARVNALLVLKNGEIVSEIYRNGSAPATRFIAMSMSKSFISALYGIAVAEGHIKSIDDPVTAYLPELKGTVYEKATIKNLLMMRSGVAWNEGANGLEQQRVRSLDEEKIYYEDYAFEAKSDVAPGTKFNYSSLDSNVLGWLLSRAIKRNVADYMAEKLWVPAGMEFPAYWMMQGPTGKQREFYAAGFNATLRDYGRFGQLMLMNGAVNGKQIVPRAWVDESTNRGTPPKPYMYQWWGGSAATDYRASGYRGQTIHVDPSTNTVIVAMSYLAGTEKGPLLPPMIKAIQQELK
jgi:CubicO group peptidase (beta-lactamase class C family)